MKKSALLLVLVLTVTLTSSASAGERARLGIRAGLAFADQEWEYSNVLGKVKRDHRTGVAAGFFLDLKLLPVLSFRPEALYVQKGSQVDVSVRTYETGVDAPTVTYKDRVDYLSLGLHAKLRTGESPFGLYLFGGPRIDVKIGTATDMPGQDYEMLLDAYKSTVSGITLGIGVERAFGGIGPISLEARYDFDLEEAVRNVGDEATLTIDNRSFSVMAGLAF